MRTRIVLGHGASGSAASMAPYVTGFAERGVIARAIDLPRGRPEAAVARFLAELAADPALALGGHSFGGRMASLAAARLGAAGSPAAHGGGPAALVLFSYPLHRPGGDDWQARSAHWPAIACPVLLLSGDRDPFARLGRLREAVGLLRDAELVVFPGVGHGLGRRLPAALDLAAAFLREHTPD